MNGWNEWSNEEVIQSSVWKEIEEMTGTWREIEKKEKIKWKKKKRKKETEENKRKWLRISETLRKCENEWNEFEEN